MTLRSYLRPVAATLCLLTLSSLAVAASHPPVPTSYCRGKIGVDYPWPAFSDSPAVNKFRAQILMAHHALYGFEYTGPEDGLMLDNGQRVAVPAGWLIAMDALPGGFTVAVAIPPQDGPFSDVVGLQMLLEQKDRLFGTGGSVSYPGNPNENPGGVRLPCSPNNPNVRAPAIIIGVPFQGPDPSS